MSVEKQCGIYRIYCRKNKKYYVGSSLWITNRWSQHRYQLKAGTHPSPYLQHAWNKYGESAFTFKVLEECDKKVLAEREQYWIDKLQPKFNSIKIIYPRKKRTSEQTAKYQATMLERYGPRDSCKNGHPRTPETTYMRHGYPACRLCARAHATASRRARGIPVTTRGSYTTCLVTGCVRPPIARGWCGTHYCCWSRHGDPTFQTSRLRTHCRRGHEFSDATIYINSKTGARQCRICLRISWRRTEAKKTEQRKKLSLNRIVE